MTLPISDHFNVTQLNTLGVDAEVDYLIRVSDIGQLAEVAAFAAEKHLPVFVFGGGSNIVLGQKSLHCVAVKVEIMGREIIEETDTYTDVRFGAGEIWDEVVAWSVEHHLYGIESLSLIPGTTGAAPVQNIGAYGQELHETVRSVEAYDLQTGELVSFTNAECEFGYRTSIFKHHAKKHYIIIGVTLRLNAVAPAGTAGYESLITELERRGVVNPSLADIRAAVIAIRTAKLPDPSIIPNVGSFFGNPIIETTVFQELVTNYPDIPHWPTDDGRTKISAAWMIEQCGFKGLLENGVGIYEKQALALINPGHLPASDVLAFRDRIINAVHAKFKVMLVMEPELIRY